MVGALRSAPLVLLPLASWVASMADAWIAMPPPSSSASLVHPSSSSSSATSESPLPSSSTRRAPSYWWSQRRSRLITTVLPSSTISNQNADGIVTVDNSGQEINVEDAVPILRTLYDAPPQLSNTANNETTTTTNGGWATKVTSGTLPTEDGSPHVLYYEVHRRFRINDDSQHTTKGLTALFLHGGPGAGCFPNHVRFFSPELYETVVLLDQRGCGRSTPLGEYRENTLELLVDDVERLRRHLLEEDGAGSTPSSLKEDAAMEQQSIRPWDVILGGSWGCTLAMAYAHTYPHHVRAMVLRGVCLFRPREIDWLFGDPRLSENGLNSNGNSSGGDMRTSNLKSLLMGNNNGRTAASTQSFQKDEPSIAQTIQEPSAIQTRESTSTTKKTAAEMFAKGWQEFAKASDIARVVVQQSISPSIIEQETQSTMTTNNNKVSSRSILRKYYNLLLGSDPLLRFSAVKSWMKWEMGIYSSGFSDKASNQISSGDKNGTSKNTVLVWNPATSSWGYEDARVSNNRSFVSVDVDEKPVEEEMVQLLRRFSSTRLPLAERSESLEYADTAAAIKPMPIQPLEVPPGKSIPTPKMTSRGNNSTTFDPTTYIPAQSMLTCYYSTNDEYCIGPYKQFLSLSPPSSIPLSSWYSSNLPPRIIPQQSSIINNDGVTPLDTSYPTSSTSLAPPLPPTIAIQGGNDAICPVDTALDLHHVWNEMELRIVLEGGHSMYDAAICGEIVKALDRFGHALKLENAGEKDNDDLGC